MQVTWSGGHLGFCENAISSHFEGLWLVAVAFLAIVCALGTLHALGTLISALGNASIGLY